MQQLQLEQQLAREQNVDEGSMMGDFVRKVPVIGKTESCHDVLNLFLRDSRIPCVILCDDKNMPHGLIMRDRFYTQMMGRFAVDLFYSRPAYRYADRAPMIIEVSEQIVRLLQMALDRPDPHFYDAVVVTAGGALSGVLTVRDLLGLSRSLQMNADGKRELILFESDRLTSNIESSLNEVRTAAARTQEECKKMKESAQLGKGQLKLVESSYQSVVTDLRKHQDQATTLLEHTNRISSISGMITELANRSNLLAMNASIEAAHAGEHGRGFQVVAGEVQSLAQQTRALSADIAQLLEYIQQLGQDTTASSAASLHEIQLSERHVREGSHMFYEMENAVHEVELSGDQVLQLAEHTVHRVQLIKYELAGMR